MLRLSGTSSALLLRLGAGLVAPTLGVLVGSRVLPKLPGVGGQEWGAVMYQPPYIPYILTVRNRKTSRVDMTSPKENSKLIGLSPIFLSIMVASNSAPNSRKLSFMSAFGCKKGLSLSKLWVVMVINSYRKHIFYSHIVRNKTPQDKKER